MHFYPLAFYFGGVADSALICSGERYDISHGKVIGFGASGGVSFFQGWAFIGKVETHLKDGSGWWVATPCVNDEISCEPFKTEVPLYDQA